MSRDFFQFQGGRGKVRDGVICDPGEHIGEPRLGINIVEFGGLCRPANYAEQVRFPQDSS